MNMEQRDLADRDQAAKEIEFYTEILTAAADADHPLTDDQLKAVLGLGSRTPPPPEALAARRAGVLATLRSLSRAAGPPWSILPRNTAATPEALYRLAREQAAAERATYDLRAERERLDRWMAHEPFADPYGPADNDPGAGIARQSAGAPHRDQYPAGTFLGELDATAVAELTAVGRNCTFASGEVIFRQGEPAGHVIVLAEGDALISVTSHGTTRTIAKRGPGDLIGERAASLAPERSASVIAARRVRGIRIDVASFSDFLERHPEVLSVLEAQLYERMTALTALDPHSELAGQNCTVLLIDIARFSDTRRTDLDRLSMVKACYRMLKDAFTKAGVDWNTCHAEDRGDGALIVVPGHVRTVDVVSRLVPRLAANLRQHNKKVLPGRRFSLRAAIDVGPITEHEHGVNGETIISAARLVEATRLKAAVLEPDVVIGIATSPFVFERVARHLPEADAYEQVKFQVKEWKGAAWMRLYRT